MALNRDKLDNFVSLSDTSYRNVFRPMRRNKEKRKIPVDLSGYFECYSCTNTSREIANVTRHTISYKCFYMSERDARQGGREREREKSGLQLSKMRNDA